MKLVWAHAALYNFKNIRDYIAEQEARAANKIAVRLYEAIQSLKALLQKIAKKRNTIWAMYDKGLKTAALCLQNPHSQQGLIFTNLLIYKNKMAHLTRFERVTSAFGGQHSIQLSYRCARSVKTDIRDAVWLWRER